MRRTLMTTALRGIVGALVVTWCVAGSSGCALFLIGGGAAGGAAGAKYVLGKLEAEVDAPVPQVQQASVQGLKSLSLPVSKNEGDMLVAQLESETADGDKISIEVNSLTETRSKITIRVGLMGDKDRSMRIWDAIRAHLPQKQEG